MGTGISKVVVDCFCPSIAYHGHMENRSPGG